MAKRNTKQHKPKNTVAEKQAISSHSSSFIKNMTSRSTRTIAHHVKKNVKQRMQQKFGELSPSIGLADVLAVLNAGRSSAQDKKAQFCIRVHVDTSADPTIALALKELLVPEGAGGYVEVCDLKTPDEQKQCNSALQKLSDDPQAVLILAADHLNDALSLIQFYVDKPVPQALMLSSKTRSEAVVLPEYAQHISLLICDDVRSCERLLSQWLAASADNKVALAAHFPFTRKHVVKGLIQTSSSQNAGLAALSQLGGAAFPALTLNQAKLDLEIAAAHGEGMNAQRAAEMGAILGSAIVYRACARMLSRRIPLAGPLLKSGIGYAGTQLTGRLLQHRMKKLS